MKKMVTLLVCGLLLMISMVATAQEQPLARVVDTVNVRAGAGTSFQALGQIPARSQVFVEARNRIGDWVLIRTQDESLRGWVASRFTYWGEGVPLEMLPVSTETFAGVPAPAAPVTTTTTSTDASIASVSVPAGEAGTGGGSALTPPASIYTEGLSPRAIELVNFLASVPIIPTISGQTRAIYQQGQAVGRAATNFSKVGDCNSSNYLYLTVFSRTNYNLGSYGYLQNTISYYKQGDDSFVRDSISDSPGYLSASVVDAIFRDTVKCGENETLLQCEYRWHNPAVSLIMLGMSDSILMDAGTFRSAMDMIAYTSTTQFVVPVFFTVPASQWANPNFEKTMEFNRIIVEVARHYNVPVVNYWLASQNLAYGGQNNNIYPSQTTENTGHFTGNETRDGFTLWNLLVLQVLDRIRTQAG